MTIADTNKLNDFHYSSHLEWIETNGLGGFASSTVSGVNTRKYHGLLIAALKPPVHRQVLVSKLDESILRQGKMFYLSTNQFPGAVYPQGYKHLRSFERDFFPVFYYQAEDIVIKKTIACINGENTTVVLYEVVEATDKFTFSLQPFYSSRDIHSLVKANEEIGQPFAFYKDVFRTMNYQQGAEIFIQVPQSEFIEDKSWHYNFEHLEEFKRGEPFHEDLFTHGKFNTELKKGSRLGVILSTEDPTGKDAFKLFRSELKRREALVKNFSTHPNLKTLALAADQFIVKRGDLNTIIAGYHWFTDWGRDTMISLTGLCLVTGRFKDAKRILQAFSDYISEGMIPNRFPDSGEAPEYNTMDATLWFFQALYKYFQYTNDKQFIKSLLPVLKDIIDWHYKGTRYNIHVDPTDELLSGGAEGFQLTWMDAKFDGWVVTPRRGKPVEINALWYNALCITSEFMSMFKYDGDASFYRMKGNNVFKNFNKHFWNDELGCLYDCIEGEIRHEEIRPNQIYALSLPFPLLSGERAVSVLKVIKRHLLTPKGLRSLSPENVHYRPVYQGDLRSRDTAYHQGTVWGYLIGAYADAVRYAQGDEAKDEVLLILNSFLEQFKEAAVGTISEISDAEPPFGSKGCIAQAWSVAEALRIAVEYKLYAPSVKEQEKYQMPLAIK